MFRAGIQFPVAQADKGWINLGRLLSGTVGINENADDLVANLSEGLGWDKQDIYWYQEKGSLPVLPLHYAPVHLPLAENRMVSKHRESCVLFRYFL